MRVGFVGWRGMVGSVLMQRMLAERDFAAIEPVFFSTSSAGGKVAANCWSVKRAAAETVRSRSKQTRASRASASTSF